MIDTFQTPEGLTNVVCTCYEFTSTCPKTGQPDFGEVEIQYIPNKLCLESKSLKFYLQEYRHAGVFCEALACRIARDLYSVLTPKELKVTVTQAPRGGIGIVSTSKL